MTYNLIVTPLVAAASCVLLVAQAADTTSPWAQFGLAGVVVGALFGMVMWLLNSHKAERKDRDELHRVERTEWRQSEEKRSERMEGVVSQLTDAIRNSKP